MSKANLARFVDRYIGDSTGDDRAALLDAVVDELILWLDPDSAAGFLEHFERHHGSSTEDADLQPSGSDLQKRGIGWVDPGY